VTADALHPQAATARAIVVDHRTAYLSSVRTGAGPQVMARLRTPAITRLRLAGCTHIAAGLHRGARQVLRPLRLLGLAI
jgi:hypothetical protein